MGIRRAFLEGNLVDDPVNTPVGEWNVLKFSIACNEGVKNASGGYDERVHYFDCEYWTKKPAYWLRILGKGKGVTLEAEPVQQRWTDNESQKQRSRVLFKLTCPPVPRSKSADALDKPPSQTNAQADGQQDVFEDDIPF